MKEYKINEYLSLRLEDIIPKKGILGSLFGLFAEAVLKVPQQATYIYVKGERFHQCKFLLLDIPKNHVRDFDEIDSIDEASEVLDDRLEFSLGDPDISEGTEFWAHCSNIQAWAEHDYDTRLLHRNMAFPLLKKLTEAGDPKAKVAFKEEIAKRFSIGHLTVMKYLIQEGYLDYFNEQELKVLHEDLKEKGIRHVIYNRNKVGIVMEGELDLSSRNIKNILDIKGLTDLHGLRSLDLSRNDIRSIEGLNGLSSLKRLDFSFNNISEIRNLDHLRNLTHLNLQGNKIREIKGLENLIHLTSLNLWFNPIRWRDLHLLFRAPRKVVEYCQQQ